MGALQSVTHRLAFSGPALPPAFPLPPKCRFWSVSPRPGWSHLTTVPCSPSSRPPSCSQPLPCMPLPTAQPVLAGLPLPLLLELTQGGHGLALHGVSAPPSPARLLPLVFMKHIPVSQGCSVLPEKLGSSNAGRHCWPQRQEHLRQPAASPSAELRGRESAGKGGPPSAEVPGRSKAGILFILLRSHRATLCDHKR